MINQGDESESVDRDGWRRIDLDAGVTAFVVTSPGGGWRFFGQLSDPPTNVPDSLVAEMEAALPEAVDELSDVEISSPLSSYTRWYRGTEGSDGVTVLVWLSACSDVDVETVEVVPFVFGGGDCSISGVYDVTTASFTRISPQRDS